MLYSKYWQLAKMRTIQKKTSDKCDKCDSTHNVYIKRNITLTRASFSHIIIIIITAVKNIHLCITAFT